MSDYGDYINALRQCAREHEDDKTLKGGVVVSALCRDTADLLEQIEREQQTTTKEEQSCETLGNFHFVNDDVGYECGARFGCEEHDNWIPKQTTTREGD